jgi:hypothetical protein
MMIMIMQYDYETSNLYRSETTIKYKLHALFA